MFWAEGNLVPRAWDKRMLSIFEEQLMTETEGVKGRIVDEVMEGEGAPDYPRGHPLSCPSQTHRLLATSSVSPWVPMVTGTVQLLRLSFCSFQFLPASSPQTSRGHFIPHSIPTSKSHSSLLNFFP